MAHLDPPFVGRVVRDAGDDAAVKIFAAFIVGEGGETTVTPFVVKSTERPEQIRELQAQVDQLARTLKNFITEHPERLGL